MQHWSSSKHKGHILWRYGGAEEAEGGASEERGVVDAEEAEETTAGRSGKIFSVEPVMYRRVEHVGAGL